MAGRKRITTHDIAISLGQARADLDARVAASGPDFGDNNSGHTGTRVGGQHRRRLQRVFGRRRLLKFAARRWD